MDDGNNGVVWARVHTNRGLCWTVLHGMARRGHFTDTDWPDTIGLDALHRASRAWDGYTSAFSTYAYRAVLYAYIQASKKHRVTYVSDKYLNSFPAPIDSDEHDTSDHIQYLLSQLCEMDRLVIIARFYGGMTYEEMADELGLVKATVHGYVKSALKKMRRIAARE